MNLNSTNKTHPQIISDFYLSAFLDSIMQNGYLIFAVDGIFPNYDPSIFFYNLANHQRYLPLQEILQNHEKEKQNPDFKLNSGGGDQDILEKILKQSKMEYEQ